VLLLLVVPQATHRTAPRTNQGGNGHRRGHATWVIVTVIVAIPSAALAATIGAATDGGGGWAACAQQRLRARSNVLFVLGR
jgi:hypothetical protein